MRVAVVGSGPAGLMAATRALARSGNRVTVFERRAGLGRKLLVAGSSGLNISHRLPPGEFARHYEGWNERFWTNLLREFGTAEWISFIENELDMETFVGTSERYFVREMKASNLLRRWTQRLEAGGVVFRTRSEISDFARQSDGAFRLSFGAESDEFDRVVFALGGGSWEEELPAWPELFRRKGIAVVPFTSANCGYEVRWTPEFLAEAEGKPLKKIVFENAVGKKSGELVVTKYGLEGTPVYFLGASGPASLDLKPDLTEEAIRERLDSVRENLAPLRRAKQKLALGEASLALLFHHLPAQDRATTGALAAKIKRFPVTLGKPRPLAEAISSRGGVSLDEVSERLELKKYPGLFCAGEMLAWHAPTGGFLIQAAVSMGARVGGALA